jgi:hypothetical protein
MRGVCIDVTTNAFDRFIDLTDCKFVGGLKQHVLYKMGCSMLVTFFVSRAGGHPQNHAHHP